MEAMHLQKFIHSTPRKIRLVADMVREMSPENALDALTFSGKSASEVLIKAIKTALANARQKGMEPHNLSFAKLEINESTRMRRFKAGTRGRAKPFKRKMSHIKIVLTDDSKGKELKAEKTNTIDEVKVDMLDEIRKEDRQEEKKGK